MRGTAGASVFICRGRADEPRRAGRGGQRGAVAGHRTPVQHRCAHDRPLRTGAVRWPNAAYRSALRAVLGVSTDAELGLVPIPRGAGSAAAPGSLSGKLLDDLEVSGRRPVRIGWTDVDHIRRTTAALAQSDNRFGGGRMCEAAVSQLKLAAGLLSARADMAVRTALVEALGNMAGVVAFAAFDINDDALLLSAVSLFPVVRRGVRIVGPARQHSCRHVADCGSCRPPRRGVVAHRAGAGAFGPSLSDSPRDDVNAPWSGPRAPRPVLRSRRRAAAVRRLDGAGRPRGSTRRGSATTTARSTRAAQAEHSECSRAAPAIPVRPCGD